jgi:hypothetical protein
MWTHILERIYDILYHIHMQFNSASLIVSSCVLGRLPNPSSPGRDQMFVCGYALQESCLPSSLAFWSRAPQSLSQVQETGARHCRVSVGGKLRLNSMIYSESHSYLSALLRDIIVREILQLCDVRGCTATHSHPFYACWSSVRLDVDYSRRHGQF